jgi:hypothetical protein
VTLAEAIAYWHRRYESEPEPFKSFAREHLEQLVKLQDGHIRDGQGAEPEQGKLSRQ